MKPITKLNKIVVTRLQNLGDIIMTTPILYRLKQMYPQAELIFITRPQAVAAARRLPFINQVLEFPDEKPLSAQWAAFKAFQHADLAYLIDNTHRIAVLAWLAGAKRRVGMTHKRKPFLTDPVDWTREMDLEYDPVTYAKMLKNTTGIDVMTTPDWNKYFFPEATDVEKNKLEQTAKENGLDLAKPYIVFAMYTGGREKDWPEDHWQALWQKVAAKYQVQVVLTGKNPQHLNMGVHVIDLADKTGIYEFGYLIKKASLVMSGCSGPMHIGRAMGTPTLGLYGPTPASLGAPPENIASIKSPAQCAPCNGYYSSPCAHPFCMAMITVDEVYAVIDKFLTERGIS
jgi:heptosyltransferase-2